ncbi:hypothetical protein E4T56_gene9856 [Termitomyces sp. T112]|nr:hypothetical protein E4T56_gene9856 [Termitomyces sp. T112]
MAPSGSGASRGMTRGDLLIFSWNGKNPVEALMVFMIAKQMQGRVLFHPLGGRTWTFSALRRYDLIHQPVLAIPFVK